MEIRTTFCCFVFLLYFSYSYGTVQFYNYLSAQNTDANQYAVSSNPSDSSYYSLSNTYDSDPNSYAFSNALTSQHPCGYRIIFDTFKFRFDWPEYAINGVYANPSFAVFTIGATVQHSIVEAKLVKNGNQYSTDRSSPTQYAIAALPAPLNYGSSSDLWGFPTLAQGDVTKDNWGISIRACTATNYPSSSYVYGVTMNITYSLSVQLNTITPNSVTTTWATYSPITVNIAGATFRNITGNTVYCKFGSVVSTGFFKDTKNIGCYVPAQTVYGPQSVAVSLDYGATWTNDPVSFNYMCNAAVLCNGRGTCANDGSCTCTPGWGGSDCNTPLCPNGVINPGEACDDGDNVDNNGCSNTCKINPGWTCVGTAPSYCKKCGNSIVETNAGEACDDGNLANGDGCSSTCTIESGWICSNSPSQCRKCGDGIIQPGETCDDKNTISGDGCSSTCTIEIGWNCTGAPSKCSLCGNSIVENGETCDDGNTVSGDGCSNKCIVESGYTCPNTGGVCSSVCGDSIKTPSEQCDDGNTVSGDGCAKNCTLEIGYNCTIPAMAKTTCSAVCGNGIITPTEACDDGNKNSGDGCSPTCNIEGGYSCSGQPSVCVPGCGDGVKTSGEECDDGNLSVGDGCSSGCKIEYGWSCNLTATNKSLCFQVCGNGIVTVSETCDTGVTPSTGCVGCHVTTGWTCSGQPSVCQFCGNGVVEGTEACDDGGYVNGDGCNATCSVEPNYVCFVNTTSKKSICSKCGDGILSGLEQCDDGNRINGDGCSSSCVVETGYICTTGSPSVCGGACGNGIITAGESCDDNNTNPDDGCNNCKITPGYSCSGQPSVCQGRCGNFYVTELTGEQCDDGNLVFGDGCNATCGIEAGWNCTGITSVCTPICGDSQKLGQEQCDDGNAVDGDGCSSTCQIETGWSCSGTPSDCSTNCGDGYIRGSEKCDPGAIPIDGCDAGCMSITPGFVCEGEPSNCSGICGDGIVVGAETCDDKNNKSGDGCSNLCQKERGYVCSGAPSVCLALCGDGIIAGLETCDDNNTFNGDGCSSTCSVEYGWICTGTTCSPICGNGFLNGNELCDDGNLNNNDGCTSNCTTEIGFYCSGTPSICVTQCSDGYTRGKEECDDGNLVDGDGCNHYCDIELGYSCEGDPSICNPICGDGIKVKAEQCDMDNGTYPLGEKGCSENCTIINGWSCSTVGNYSNCIEICGNGIVTESEQCDDGNTAALDGCFQCKIESGWSCVGKVESVCTETLVFINPGTNKSTLGMAIAFPVAGFFLIAGLIAFILIKRRNKYKKLIKPDFSAIAFDDKTFGASAEDISTKKREVLDSLEKLLTEDDQYWLALTLCNLTAVTELDKLTKALIFLFYHHNKAVDLVKLAVKEEVNKSETENTLFRGNSYASKMFTSYSRITGLEYLWYTLGLMICEVNELGKPREAELPATDSQQSIRHTSSLINISLELDPRKMDDNADIMSNQIQIQLFVHKLWKTISDSEKKIPTDFREVFATISEEVNKKYGDKNAVYKGVGGFFFLRFVCPSITSPHIYGLLPEPLYEASQRYAILLSKVLQNISNGTLPGNKEEYMAFLNKFIEQHIPQAMSFFDKIVVPEGHRIGVEQYPVPQNHRDNSLVWIQKHLKVIQSKLQVEMSDSAKSEEFRKAIQAVMDYE